MKKTKGYSKGGMKMMKAMKGKMAKGMRKGGVKTAMGGKMMTKGMRRGGIKTAMGGRMMAKGMRKGNMAKGMTVAQLRALAKKKGYTLKKA